MGKKGKFSRPVVAITMGDPSGVGPEVILKALAQPRVRSACLPLVVGDGDFLGRTQRRIKSCPFRLVPWEEGQPLPRNGENIPVDSISQLSPPQCRPGRPTKAGGHAAFQFIQSAVHHIHSGTAQAMATAPISKKILHSAGHPYPGHTEILAEMTGTRNFRMMLMGKNLKVILVTVHLPLTQIAKEISRRQIRVTLEVAHKALRDYFRISRPRLAVAGLNPHAGEEGLLGWEERRIIAPAVRDACRQGIRAFGPLAADSLFHQAVRGDYDAVICMYHDQGLGPLKLLHFFDGVNVTLGLPIIRTSVDHGTAYEIAGKNKAHADSMAEAILLASRLAARREQMK